MEGVVNILAACCEGAPHAVSILRVLPRPSGRPRANGRHVAIDPVLVSDKRFGWCVGLLEAENVTSGCAGGAVRKIG